ncbi:uncharacterized protein LOC128955464 [Oppia nitens]|uniref:uncharacterized protein LOC128955464 n=1 Tax=Oppia nitens TaxID=1686743 RepID=UPI0023DA0733|nr:uncharacterized protein LOC128955464 [Oppia nitens]XP_054157113.1 uncharacterized protein LOC128955464 [Oppia nitens]
MIWTSMMTKMNDQQIVCNVIVNAHECEGSIAEAKDCLRSVSHKLEWFERKQLFCPHLISIDDSAEVMTLINRVATEELPVIDYDHKLNSGQESEVSNDLHLRVRAVVESFKQIKKMLQLLYNNIELIIKKEKLIAI